MRAPEALEKSAYFFTGAFTRPRRFCVCIFCAADGREQIATTTICVGFALKRESVTRGKNARADGRPERLPACICIQFWIFDVAGSGGSVVYKNLKFLQNSPLLIALFLIRTAICCNLKLLAAVMWIGSSSLTASPLHSTKKRPSRHLQIEISRSLPPSHPYTQKTF